MCCSDIEALSHFTTFHYFYWFEDNCWCCFRNVFFFFLGSLFSLSLLFGCWLNFPRFLYSAWNCFLNLLKGVLNLLWIWVFLLLQMSELVLKLFLHLTTLMRAFLNVICCFSGYSVSSGAVCSWYLKLKKLLDFLCHRRQKCLSSKIKKMVFLFWKSIRL